MQGRAVTATRWKVDHEANPLCRPRQSGTSLSEPTTTRDTPIRGKRRYHLPASESHVLHPKNYPLLEPEGQCQGCTTTTTRGPKKQENCATSCSSQGDIQLVHAERHGIPFQCVCAAQSDLCHIHPAVVRHSHPKPAKGQERGCAEDCMMAALSPADDAQGQR